MDAIQLWDNAQSIIRQHINEVVYNTFIRDLTAHSLDGDRMTLMVKAPFMRQMLISDPKLIRTMEDALHQLTGRDMRVFLTLTAEMGAEALPQEPAVIMPEPAKTGIPLNPKYTFDTFVVGKDNMLAHAAALAAAESPGQQRNPLFIYGGVGLGKTHLMHAIGHHVQSEHPDMQLLYITSEEFTNELIEAIKNNCTNEFRNRFRKVDVLMVDDIQFIAGRDRTQEEFFHTFNALYNANKQIVLASDRPPQDIARLEERLCSRFGMGMLADIRRPDLETRIAILRKKATSEYVVVKDDVLEMIASRIDRNIRELEGCLTRLIAYANLMNKPITKELCEEALREVFAKEASRVVTVDTVIQTVARYYSLEAEELTGKSRRHEVTVPRQIAMYFTREMTDMSLPQIGDAFGGRDHTTVLYSCRTIAKNAKDSANTSSLLQDIRRLIQEAK